jgi:hypothetical protein
MVHDIPGGFVKGKVGQEWNFLWPFVLFASAQRQLSTFFGMISLSSSVGGCLRINAQGSICKDLALPKIPALFVLWKIRCKVIFTREVSPLSSFCSLWRDEVCHQLLAK